MYNRFCRSLARLKRLYEGCRIGINGRETIPPFFNQKNGSSSIKSHPYDRRLTKWHNCGRYHCGMILADMMHRNQGSPVIIKGICLLHCIKVCLTCHTVPKKAGHLWQYHHLSTKYRLLSWWQYCFPDQCLSSHHFFIIDFNPGINGLSNDA